jgi:hypothetical protein
MICQVATKKEMFDLFCSCFDFSLSRSPTGIPLLKRKKEKPAHFK